MQTGDASISHRTTERRSTAAAAAFSLPPHLPPPDGIITAAVNHGERYARPRSARLAATSAAPWRSNPRPNRGRLETRRGAKDKAPSVDARALSGNY